MIELFARWRDPVTAQTLRTSGARFSAPPAVRAAGSN